MESYQKHLEKHNENYVKINAQFRFISILRILAILAVFVLFYFFLSTQNSIFLVITLATFVGFLFLVKLHANNVYKRNLTLAYVNRLQAEIDYIKDKKLSYHHGGNYKINGHAYSNDLDLFGEQSVFHHMNRTGTLMGERQLAHWFQNLLPKNEIQNHQEAIREASEQFEWRQTINAYADLTEETDAQLKLLDEWKDSELLPISTLTVVISYITSALFMGSFIGYFFTDSVLLMNLTIYSFLLNVALLFGNFKKFKNELQYTAKADDILKNYSVIFQTIENKNFTSTYLQTLQNELKNDQGTASTNIRKLSQLFSQMDNVQNPVGAMIINGIFPYHFRVYQKLSVAKKAMSKDLPRWLQVIGKVDAINSLANFAYNEKDYVFPTINNEEKIAFEGLGHPLIPKHERVTNDVAFHEHPFMILTGSNMSGKSTFLRSLGVNLVLSQIGAPVCAQKASVHPFPIWVSMRLEDNLNENESYFFAEVKRLQKIMHEVDHERTFVLLDEILRGTNSDDKRSGTIEVIKKLVNKKCVGVVATHDLEVCNTTSSYPDYIRNMRFEADITNDELHFDYQLREGICQNKNATFLMKKMGVI